MFLWAKQLVFHVRQAASNLRARTDPHSLLCPDSPAHSTEPLNAKAAFRQPLAPGQTAEACQAHLLKDLPDSPHHLSDQLKFPF